MIVDSFHVSALPNVLEGFVLYTYLLYKCHVCKHFPLFDDAFVLGLCA